MPNSKTPKRQQSGGLWRIGDRNTTENASANDGNYSKNGKIKRKGGAHVTTKRQN